LELVHCGHGFILPIANDPSDSFSFYKAFKQLLIDTDVSLIRIKEYSDPLRKERETPRKVKEVAKSVTWLREWINSSNDLPEQIHKFVLDAIEGRAAYKEPYNIISPLRSQLDSHTFNTLRAHLNRITSNPKYIPLQPVTQDRPFIATRLSEECQSFEQITRRIFNENERLDISRSRKPAASVISILFLAADPTDASRLRLGEELREIQEKLRLAELREQFELHQRMSVRPTDISQALLDVEPRIVHFSGHGIAAGTLCFENQMGSTHPMHPDALAALFEQFNKQVNCVVLNACYSEIQATAIAKHIDYVVGMNEAVGDSAAIAFAVGFYQALGAGRTIKHINLELCKSDYKAFLNISRLYLSRESRYKPSAPPNNSLNRSANSVAFIRETWMLDALNARPVNSGVGR